MNEENIIEAQYNTITATASLFTSMSDPVIGEVSNYPNPFRAGTESTNIDYLLDESTDVKIKIYTLFGDLVLTKEFRSGEPGAIAGRMNTFAWDGKNEKGDIVGNGGYICVVEAVIDGKREKMVRKIGVAK
jgi:flagellar hook assembly protein FlgD